MKKENRSISVLKGIACVLVIINHYHVSGITGDVLYAISHFGVPIFFLVSGYYLYNGEQTLEGLPRKIKHIFSLFSIHICLNIFCYIIEKLILYKTLIRRDIVTNEILSHFTLDSLIDSLLWSKTLFGTAQWFLIALLEAYVLFYLIYRYCRANILEDYGIIIAVVLFIIHIPVRILLLKLGITTLLDESLTENSIVRNVWFDALPFMLVGLWLRKSKASERILRIRKLLPVISIGTLILSVAEYYLTVVFLNEMPVSSVLYFGTILSTVFAFIWAICNPEGCTGWLGKRIEYLGKNLSMIVYFIFVIVASYLEIFLNNIMKKDVGISLCFDWWYPILVVVSTIVLAWAIFKIKLEIDNKHKVNITKYLFAAICFTILLLPVGSEWRMLAKSNQAAEQIILDESLNQNYQSTIMVTAQDNAGRTVDSVQIPIQQFIGAGVTRGFYVLEGQCYYSVSYVEPNCISIEQSENLNQIRIWIK